VSATAERRRLGRIVHDDRGAASVEWHDAPSDYERPVFEIEETGLRPRESKVRGGLDVLSINNDDTFNPYDRSPKPAAAPGKGLGAHSSAGGKRDLKKLSEWLKMMRELEERKTKSDDSDD
jgi:hypothetical protein